MKKQKRGKNGKCICHQSKDCKQHNNSFTLHRGYSQFLSALIVDNCLNIKMILITDESTSIYHGMLESDLMLK